MKISTVIPFYNDSVNLRRCLESIKMAQPGPYEVIVVDDFSTQDTSAIIKAYPLVRLIRLKYKKGPGFSRYIGAKVANGDVIAFLDSDCYIIPDWFSIIQKNLKKEIGGIVGEYMLGNRDKIVSLYELADLSYCYHKKHKQDMIETTTAVGGCCAFWKYILSEIDYKNIFLFDKFAAGEDSILGFEIEKKYRIMKVNDFIVYHNFRESWWKYFRRRAIDGYSHTIISILYAREILKKKYLNYFYILIQLALTSTILLFLAAFFLTKTFHMVALSFILMFIVSEIGFARYIFGLEKLKKSNKLLLILLRPVLSFLRNIFWLFGILWGISYIIAKKNEVRSL